MAFAFTKNPRILGSLHIIFCHYHIEEECPPHMSEVKPLCSVVSSYRSTKPNIKNFSEFSYCSIIQFPTVIVNNFKIISKVDEICLNEPAD